MLVSLSRYFIVTFVVVLLLTVGVPGASQGQNQSPPEAARFRLADSYLRTGQHERAIPLLEDLYQSNPNSHIFYRKLKEAYAALKRYDQAISLVEKRLESSSTPGLMAEKAALLDQKGEPQAALDTWQKTIELQPQRPYVYRTVYLSMVENRRFDEAVKVLLKGRDHLDSPNLFSIDLANLYGLTSRHTKAAGEYLKVLKENPSRLSLVKQRLARFTDQDNALAQTAAVVEQQLKENSSFRPYRELAGWLYLQTRQYTKAFDEFQQIDRLSQGQGTALYMFAQKAASASAYQAAADAYEVVLDRYPNSPAAAQAQLGLARIHKKQAEEAHERAHDYAGNAQKTPHYSAALEAYRTFSQNYPDHPAHPRTLHTIGTLQLKVFRDPGRAEAVFQEILQKYPDSKQAPRAQLALGQVALLRNQLPKAQQAFEQVGQMSASAETATQARYEQALLHFYQGQFDLATNLASSLMENTSTDIANDALKLKLLITDHQGPDSLHTALQTYAQGRLFFRQARYQQASSVIDTLLTKYPSHGLVDNGFFLKAKLLHERGRPQQAAETLLQLATRYRDSPLADKSLFQAAGIYADEMQDRETALQTYTKLLERYPGSLHLPNARTRIRQLRASG